MSSLRRFFTSILALLFMLSLLASAAPSANAAPEATRYFPETGKTVSGRLLEYWNATGGLIQNGFPLTEEIQEKLDDGNVYVVQYFERTRLEKHPEKKFPYDVLIGQFGRRIHPLAPAVKPERDDSGRFFPETGHNVRERFLLYWNANGDLPQFGYPLTEEITETLSNGETYLVQYFERARFEYHPKNSAQYKVLLGQFGREILADRFGTYPVVLSNACSPGPLVLERDGVIHFRPVLAHFPAFRCVITIGRQVDPAELNFWSRFVFMNGISIEENVDGIWSPLIRNGMVQLHPYRQIRITGKADTVLYLDPNP